ncbi:MAG TPA: HAMP domain-containing sensor histidine kinase [Ktedonobacteraceae bacterium]|nr:HAMP domain-containing sensor histidine kinase [Ktedonobacteraceae bacterium]
MKQHEHAPGMVEGSLDWERIRQERGELQRSGQRVPYISFILIHVGLALFLLTLFLVDRLALDDAGKLALRIALIAGAILFLASAWLYAIMLSRRFKSLLARSLQMETAYAQQERLNALKDQFIANVSHELRTPLTELNGYLDLLSERGDTLNATARASFLNNARRGCNELINIVMTILDSMHPCNESESMPKIPVLIVPLVREVIDSFSTRETARYPITVQIAEDISVLGDEQAIRQIMRNLLSNAFKYCPAGTTIIVAATLQTSAQPTVRLCVCDTGPGIPPKEQPLLFERFVRLQRDLTGSIRGTGLGLYISKQLVESMGGQIWLESTGIPGEGTCFYCALPALSSAKLPVLDVRRYQ